MAAADNLFLGFINKLGDSALAATGLVQGVPVENVQVGRSRPAFSAVISARPLYRVAPRSFPGRSETSLSTSRPSMRQEIQRRSWSSRTG